MMTPPAGVIGHPALGRGDAAMDDAMPFMKRVLTRTTVWGAMLFVLAIGKALIDGRSLSVVIVGASAILCWFTGLLIVLVGQVRRLASDAVTRKRP
jgi:hypothetical protein